MTRTACAFWAVVTLALVAFAVWSDLTGYWVAT